MKASILLLALAVAATEAASNVTISGELKQWHKVTLTFDGPLARERDNDPNPFTDYRLTVTFVHESGSPRCVATGYFAADGNAANTSADADNKWRAHLSPDKPGRWSYTVSFVKGKLAAVSAAAGEPLLLIGNRYSGGAGTHPSWPAGMPDFMVETLSERACEGKIEGETRRSVRSRAATGELLAYIVAGLVS